MNIQQYWLADALCKYLANKRCGTAIYTVNIKTEMKVWYMHCMYTSVVQLHKRFVDNRRVHSIQLSLHCMYCDIYIYRWHVYLFCIGTYGHIRMCWFCLQLRPPRNTCLNRSNFTFIAWATALLFPLETNKTEISLALCACHLFAPFI